MDQGSNDIRQDIDSTRAALNDNINRLEAKASQAFNLKNQVAERPWLMLGAAVATGYVLGSLIDGDNDYRYRPSSNYTSSDDVNNQYRYYQSSTSQSGNYTQQPSQPQAPSQGSFLSPFDDEIDTLKVAAIETVRGLLHDTIREYAPAIGKQLDQMSSQQASATDNYGGMSQNLSGSSPGPSSSSPRQTYGSTPSSPVTSTGDRDYVKTYHPSN